MICIRYLTPQLRRELKRPLGIVLQGSTQDIVEQIKTLIRKEKPPKIVTVGDKVSEDLTCNSLQPDLLIVDNRIMRKAICPISATADRIMTVKNPPGTITDQAWKAIMKAMKSSRSTKIVVDGEEDLLTLPAIISAPEGSLVVYGQPHEGVVVIEATEAMKQKVRKIVNAMKNISQPPRG